MLCRFGHPCGHDILASRRDDRTCRQHVTNTIQPVSVWANKSTRRHSTWVQYVCVWAVFNLSAVIEINWVCCGLFCVDQHVCQMEKTNIVTCCQHDGLSLRNPGRNKNQGPRNGYSWNRKMQPSWATVNQQTFFFLSLFSEASYFFVLSSYVP